MDQPLVAVSTALRRFDWDWQAAPIVRLTGHDVSSVLRRYLALKVTASDLEEWANLLECRDDIEIDSNAAEAIFILANPVLHGSAAAVAPTLLARL
ncbi:hypothetical protein HNO88_003056 [Novosphingobium chloroacetimidivorans]|uniref:Uncharacterized protein n=1 Tax=Novosphingobium chloroacetimidivorans TaxID=1428314 RepID=A0A7W7KBE8_9SPHN|nr:hypothetical protein [Novosphingobium chloroacetimidivorans]MBB4859727.1 hypothetical protein [Novosphingobium chloroacetimidivorans]